MKIIDIDCWGRKSSMSLNRNIGLDIVRAFAIVFVLSVHFFGQTHFYTTPLIGYNMYIQVFFRMTFIVCVPLFLVLTGYLQINKEPTRSYYKKVIPIIVIYVIYSVLAILVRVFYFNEHKSVIEWVASICNFTADGYSWYINMYIGLFLISPFLNIMYKNLKTKRQKQLLIAIFVFVTGVPNFLNGKLQGVLFFPDYWTAMYPITYYFIGNYIREYQCKLNKKKGALGLLAIILLEVFFEVHYAGGGQFLMENGSYGSFIITVQTILFFLIFYNVSMKNRLAVKVISTISILSLDIYLASFITDKFVYGILFSKYFLPQHHMLVLFIPIVGTTFLLAFSLAFVRNKLVKLR
ncbi:acyltransferase [Microbacteriaceae bacterium 4G12]